ncbi:MAG: SdrD B-like domain-containing protein [Cyanobacteria bacterium P01_A01_bin.84]
MKALFNYLLARTKRQKHKLTTSFYPVVRGKTTHSSYSQSSYSQITYLQTALLTILFTVPQFVIFAGVSEKKTFAQSPPTSCPAGTTPGILNWTAVNDRAGIESQTPSIEDITASFRFTEAVSNVIDEEETRIIGGVYGGLPGPNLQFNIGVGDSPAPPNGTATLTINFNRPVTLASPLQLLDIDRNGERDVGFVYQDTVRVRASNGNTPVGVSLSAVGRNVRIVNNQARGIRENSFPDQSDGNALAEIAGPVTQIQIIYTAGTEFGTPEQDETIGLARLNLCVGTPENGSIGDTVFDDRNGNGTQDEGEPGVPNVNLTLIAPGPDNTFGTADDTTTNTTTNGNGNYGFDELPPGQYRVTVTPPSNLPEVTTNGGSEVDVNLEAGQRRDDIDFGLRASSGGSIRGTVFTDPNANGIQDTNDNGVPNNGENGIGNITVTLRNSDNEVVATTTTDDNGDYQFTNLPLGEYRVESGTPDNLSATTETVLSANLTDNNPNTNDVDFGFRPAQVGAGGDVNLRLVKRITNVVRNGQAIGGNFSSFIDDPNDDDDNVLNNSSQTSPVGVPQLETPVRSGDEVEYTVYYLTEGGDPLENVRLCDLIPLRTSFSPNAFGNATGIALRQGADNSTFSNAQDGDRGTFYSPLTPLSGQPGGDACSNQSNPNGAVVLNIGTITPSDNFGFFRFRVRID